MKNLKKIADMTSKQFAAALTRNGFSQRNPGALYEDANSGVTLSASGLTRRAILASLLRASEQAVEEVAALPQPAIALVESLPDTHEMDAAGYPAAEGKPVDEFQVEVEALLGAEGIYWSNGERFRVGVRTQVPGRYVEDGKLMIGAGVTAKAALKDAARRMEAHAAKQQAA